MSKTHWKQLINPDFLGAYALPEGRDLTVEIQHVQREMVTSTGGKKEECTVAHIKGLKPLILNRTNSKSIAKLYGPYVEDWAGKKITLYASTTKLAGETVECIRIRPQVTVIKQKISDERLRGAIESIETGQWTVAQLFERFDITLAQKRLIDDALNQPVEPVNDTAAEQQQSNDEIKGAA